MVGLLALSCVWEALHFVLNIAKGPQNDIQFPLAAAGTSMQSSFTAGTPWQRWLEFSSLT